MPNRAHDSAYSQGWSSSRRFQDQPRAALLEALGMAVASGAASGDLEVARVATEALSKLLSSKNGDDASVVDLNAERAKRDEEP
jgi:hypothetical protein